MPSGSALAEFPNVEAKNRHITLDMQNRQLDQRMRLAHKATEAGASEYWGQRGHSLHSCARAAARVRT